MDNNNNNNQANVNHHDKYHYKPLNSNTVNPDITSCPRQRANRLKRVSLKSPNGAIRPITA